MCVCMSMYNVCICVSTYVDRQMDGTLLSTLWCECTYVRARVCIHICVYICRCVCVHMYTTSGWWVVVAHSARRRSFHVKKSSKSKNCTCAHTRVIGIGLSVGVCECVYCVWVWWYACVHVCIRAHRHILIPTHNTHSHTPTDNTHSHTPTDNTHSHTPTETYMSWKNKL